MSQPTETPAARYAALAETILNDSDATQAGKGFGADALKLRGKIFAMLTRDRLVVKLPKARVDTLIAAGYGERFDPRHDGRLMKEWLVVAPTHEGEWEALAREAMEYGAGG